MTRDERVRDLVSVHDDVTLAGMYLDVSVRLAQAEQERDARRDRKVAVEEMAVRLREYEEALKRYENEAPEWLKPIARAALADSGGRDGQ